MSNEMNLEYQDYFFGVFDEATPAHQFDYLVRVAGTTADDMEFHVTGTQKFKKYFGNIFDYYKFVKDTLAEVILSQKQSLDYNGVYNAFLLGQLSEEEFEKTSRKFIYKPKRIDPIILSSKINILFKYTKIDYSTSEIAVIFQCNISNVDESIQLITGNKLRKIQ